MSRAGSMMLTMNRTLMKYILLTPVLLYMFSGNTLFAQTSAENKIEIQQSEKDLWLATGMGLAIAGSGHFYLGDYSRGAVFTLGTYGLMAAGISTMMSAHSTRTVVVDGNSVREVDNTNRPLYFVGALFFTSGILMYVSNVIDIYLEVSEYNRRLERLKRYSQSQRFAWSAGSDHERAFIIASYRF